MSVFRRAENRPASRGPSASGPAADVFSVRYGFAPTLFASALSLGLGASTDNVDALDFYACPTETATFMQLHGIRLIPGDWNDDAYINLPDFPPWNTCMTGPDRGPLLGDCKYCDFDKDTDLDIADLARMQVAFCNYR